MNGSQRQRSPRKKTSFCMHFTTTSKCRAFSKGLCSGFSAPTNLNRKFVNNRTRVAKFRDTVSNAIELTCNIAFDGAHTPRGCFLRAVTILLCHAPDKDWKLEEEMHGRRVREDRIARLSAVRGSAGRAKLLTETEVSSHLTCLVPLVLSSSLVV